MKKKLQEIFIMLHVVSEHGFHKAFLSDAVRRVFSYDGRIVGSTISM